MHVTEQQRAFDRLLEAAGGELRIVEQAIDQEAKAVKPNPPTFRAVLDRIKQMRARRDHQVPEPA